jgi:hypothetical protein
MFLNEEFLKLWEELSDLNEAKADTQRLIDFAGEDLANRFLAAKNRLKAPENDLYYWIKNKTVNELEQAVTELENSKSATRAKRDIADEGAELVYESEHWKVYHITTFEASQKYGRDTRWCITGVDNYGDQYWKQYHERDKVDFYFLIKKGTYNARGTDSKFAVAIYPNNFCEVFDQQDNSISLPEIPYIDEIDYARFKGLSIVGTSYYICVDTSGGKTKENDRAPRNQALAEILAFINSLTQEEKDNVGLSWNMNTANDDEGDLIVSVYSARERDYEPLTELEDRMIGNDEDALEQIARALNVPDLFEVTDECSSYIIRVEGSNKSIRRRGVADSNALDEIVAFINTLSKEEKANIALDWNWDAEEPGDMGNDLIVVIYGPKEREPGEEYILVNWDYAGDIIKKALNK